jgi:hypothetical protein
MKHKTGDFVDVNTKYLTAGTGYLDTAYIDKVDLSSTWYQNLWIPAVAMHTTATASKEITSVSTAVATVGQVGIFLDASASELAAFSFVLPKDYKEGTDLLPYVCYTSTTSTFAAGIIAFGLSYQAIHATPTTAIVNLATQMIYTNGSTDVLGINTTYFAAITGTNYKAGSIVNGCIFRNATATTDNFAGDAVVYGIGFLYEVDGMGSTYKTIFAK